MSYKKLFETWLRVYTSHILSARIGRRNIARVSLRKPISGVNNSKRKILSKKINTRINMMRFYNGTKQDINGNCKVTKS